MMTEIPAKKKHWWSTDSSADEHHEDHPEVKTVKREVKHLRRITKRGEMALGHMSEALEREKVGEKELDITREVMEGISETPVPAPAPVKPAAPRDTTFVCYECGAKIPRDSIRCPSCDILYVLDPKDEAIDVYLTLKDETVSDGTDTRVFSEGSMAFAHFDLKIGEVTCLRTEQGDTDFGLECHNCGALTQFGTDMCPLCGHSFDEWDTGLVGLMEGLKFDLDDDKELNCPRCGEHIVVNEGKCPACKELITFHIDPAKCQACLICLKKCPTGAIEGGKNRIH